MGRKSRTGVLKRQREAKKAEKAAQKREKRERREGGGASGSQVATAEDLAGYGFAPEEPEDDGKRRPPSRVAPAPVRAPGRRRRLPRLRRSGARKEMAWPVSR
jgi:hypothetical protein